MVTKLEKPLTARAYQSDVKSDWCPGCGDFGIVAALQGTLAELQLPPDHFITYSGVGCSSKSPHLMQTYGVHTLHGRSLPFAQGTALCNPDIPIVVTGGDGDGYGIGAGHFMHIGRRNVNITYLVYNNEVYGLTKGQASPTLGLGEQPKSLPEPNSSEGVDPLALAICAGYTFVARSYAYNRKHLMSTIKRAINHKGVAIVDILQPCPTYNDLRTKDFFAEEITVSGATMPRIYDIEEEGYNGKVENANDPTEVTRKEVEALTKIRTPEPRTAIGVFFEIDRSTYYERMCQTNPALKDTPPYKAVVAGKDGKPTTTLNYKDFRTDTY